MSRLKMVAITLVLLVVLLITGFSVATFLFSAALKTDIPTTPTSPATLTDSETQRGNATIQTLFSSATTPIECAITFDDAYRYQTGTLFIGEGQLRIDILVSETMVLSTVIDPLERVAWTYDVVTGSTSPVSYDGSHSEQPVAYTCIPWEIDRSVFALPL